MFEYTTDVPVGNTDDTHTNIVTADGKDDENTATNTATADADVTYDDVTPAIAVTKQVDANGDGTFNDSESVSEGGVGDQSVTYQYTVTNESSGSTDPLTLTTLVDDNGTTGDDIDLLDGFVSGSEYGSYYQTGDTDGDYLVDKGESWVFEYTTDVPVGNVDDTHTNIVTADGKDDEDTATNTATADADVTYTGVDPTINIEKTVDANQDGTFNESELVEGGLRNVDYQYVVTNTSLAGDEDPLSIISLVDDRGTATDTSDDITLVSAGVLQSGVALVKSTETGDDTDDLLETGETWTYTLQDVALDLTGNHTNTVVVAAVDDEGTAATDSDTATIEVFNPVTFEGNPQFNFPNNVDKIQPKMQGGAFTINPLAYVFWDFYTPDEDAVRIETDPLTFLTRYTDLTVSILKIWDDYWTATGGEAVYRVYVSNETATSVSLANNTNIVEYTILNAAGVTPSSSDKNLLDLVNADPLIDNFNNFNNIENALTKLGNNFLIGPTPTEDGNANKIWASNDLTGVTVDPAVDIDALAGNDLIYGVDNTGSGAGMDELSGDGGRDTIDGRDGDDLIMGGNGDDYLFGSIGNDQIIGGRGNDILFGSYLVDELTGDLVGDSTDPGRDIFILRQGDFEVIHDFTVGEDKLLIWDEQLEDINLGLIDNVLNPLGQDLASSAAVPGPIYDITTGYLSYNGELIADLGTDLNEAGVYGDIIIT